jgi:hypothetical protein
MRCSAAQVGFNWIYRAHRQASFAACVRSLAATEEPGEQPGLRHNVSGWGFTFADVQARMHDVAPNTVILDSGTDDQLTIHGASTPAISFWSEPALVSHAPELPLVALIGIGRHSH